VEALNLVVGEQTTYKAQPQIATCPPFSSTPLRLTASQISTTTMSRSRISLLASLLFLFFACGSALEVSADSPCALKCIDDPRTGNVSDYYSSRTMIRDLSCENWQYDGTNSTSVGQKFKDCQNCMLKSGWSDPISRETDRTWFLCR
jgi:hypothetical protein